MSNTFPVEIEVHSPPRFDRVQLLLRLAILLAIGILGVSLGWIVSALYLVLPAFAAVAIATRGPERYLAEVAPPLAKVLRWVTAFYAYMLIVVDYLPLEAEPRSVRLSIAPTGQPTIASALLRWITSIPSAFVLGLLAFVGGILALLGALSVLGTHTQPAGMLRYQRAVLAWQARLLAYHASVVQEYPPFHLDLESGATDLHATGTP